MSKEMTIKKKISQLGDDVGLSELVDLQIELVDLQIEIENEKELSTEESQQLISLMIPLAEKSLLKIVDFEVLAGLYKKLNTYRGGLKPIIGGQLKILISQSEDFAKMWNLYRNSGRFYGINLRDHIKSRLTACFKEKIVNTPEKIDSILTNMQVSDNQYCYFEMFFKDILDNDILDNLSEPIKLISLWVEKDSPSRENITIGVISLDWLKNHLEKIEEKDTENFSKLQSMFFSAKGIVKRVVKIKLKKYLSECSMESLMTFRSAAKEEIKEMVENAIVDAIV